MQVEILNWEKFNPRKDIARHSWFRLENTLISDLDFYDFTPAEMWAWIYMLSIRSQKRKSIINIKFDHAEKLCRLKKKTILNTIEKLKKIQCIRVIRNGDDTEPVRERTDTYTTNERTNVRTNYIVEAKKVLDFLNELTGKRFHHVESNLKYINARLTEGFTVKQLSGVASFKLQDDWFQKDNMKYMRPSTLYNSEKFNNYLQELIKYDKQYE